jgi:hypothetical protein
MVSYCMARMKFASLDFQLWLGYRGIMAVLAPGWAHVLSFCFRIWHYPI